MSEESTLQDGLVGIIHYTLTSDEGEIIDSSEGSTPLPYLHGASNIVPGLEAALAGRKVGDRFDVSVPPEQGYGLRQGLPQPVPREAFGPQVDQLRPGQQIFAQTEDGNHVPVWVAGIGQDHILIDSNHPLAGKTLNFAIEVVGMREPTEEELAHGHPHGLDGTAGHEH